MNTIATIQAAVAAQSDRVQAEVISCLRRGTLNLEVAAIKNFIETDFLSTNDLVAKFGEEAADVRGDACNDLVEKFRSIIEDPLHHSQMVDAAHSIDRVVEIINDDESNLGVNKVAGYYAFQGALENAQQNKIEFGGTSDELDIHLECLQEAGAEFDYAAAMRFAKLYSEQHIVLAAASEQDDETNYMNLETGSVDTRDGWFYTNEDGDTVNAVDLGEVVEVVKTNGEWVEV